MRIETETLAEDIYSIIKKSKYSVYMLLYPRRNRSIDLIVYSHDEKLFIKAIYDVADLDKTEIMDLKKSRRAYETKTLIVAVENKNKALEDDVIYVKQNVSIVTPNTLEKRIIHNNKPIVMNVHGNYILKINPERFKEKIRQHGFSRSGLAEMLGVSRKTIYMYEKGDMFISLEKGLELATLLGEDIFEELDFQVEDFETSSKEECSPRDQIEIILLRAAKHFGQLFLNFSRTPIDVVLKGRSTISIIKEDLQGELMREKIENAEKIANATNTPIVTIGSLSGFKELKRILRIHK